MSHSDTSLEHLHGYRIVKTSVGVVARHDRVQLRMWGKDPVRMLNGLITNDLAAAGAGRVVYGAMLTPKGRIITDLRAVLLGDGDSKEVMIDIPRVALEATRAHLTKYVPPLFARWEPTGARCITVLGSRSAEAVSLALGFDPPREGTAVRLERADGKIMVMATAIGVDPGFDLFVAEDQAEPLELELLNAATGVGGGRVSAAVLETLRIEAGLPLFGVDMTDESMPAEVFTSAGLMADAVSFTKGCYTGQEVVVRIAHRGHANRHLRGLLVDGAPPEPGTRIFNGDGRDVGWTTSSTPSPLMGANVALAILRREIEPGATVRVGSPEGSVANVVGLPFHPPTARS